MIVQSQCDSYAHIKQLSCVILKRWNVTVLSHMHAPVWRLHIPERLDDSPSPSSYTEYTR